MVRVLSHKAQPVWECFMRVREPYKPQYFCAVCNLTSKFCHISKYSKIYFTCQFIFPGNINLYFPIVHVLQVYMYQNLTFFSAKSLKLVDFPNFEFENMAKFWSQITNCTKILWLIWYLYSHKAFIWEYSYHISLQYFCAVYTACVTNFGVGPLKSNHFLINGITSTQRTPKEAPDNSPSFINF